jgi:hypothetical protein
MSRLFINKRWLLFLVFMTTIIYLQPATAQNSIGARSIAMGQTGVALPGTSWSAFANAALMPENRSEASFYGFRYVGISEITDMAASLTYSTNLGVFGGAVHRYGFNLFNENRFLAAYKNRLGKFHYGGSISYIYVNQGGQYGSAGAVGFDLGVAAEVTPDIWFGARATNINQPAYGPTDEDLPRELAAGISYYITRSALITTEIVKDVMFPVSFRTGVEFEVLTSLYARAGFTTQPETYSFGFGYLADRWSINFGLQQHNPLGLSPALDLGIQF